MDNNIYVVGIGWVGLSLAVIFADKGFHVTGIDKNEELVSAVNKGKLLITEPQLVQPMASAVKGKRFRATSKVNEVRKAKTVILAVNFTTEQRKKAIQTITEIGKLLMPDQLVIIATTIPVDMVDETRRIFEKESGLVVEKNLFLAFTPERFVEGSAVEEIHKLPQLVGVYGDKSFKRTKKLLSSINKNIVRLSPKTAMLAKLINNVYRNTIFALANEIALISEMYGVDAVETIKAANYEYARCNIPMPGLVGGPCLPKDSYLLITSRSEFPDLVITAKKLNDHVPHHIFRTIVNIRKPTKVCILGMAYKRGVGDIRGSQAKVLADLFADAGVKVSVHDPYISKFSVESALNEADTIILATNHAEYSNVPDLIPEGCVFYDCWNMYEPVQFKKGVKYVGLGRNTYGSLF